MLNKISQILVSILQAQKQLMAMYTKTADQTWEELEALKKRLAASEEALAAARSTPAMRDQLQQAQDEAAAHFARSTALAEELAGLRKGLLAAEAAKAAAEGAQKTAEAATKALQETSEESFRKQAGELEALKGKYSEAVERLAGVQAELESLQGHLETVSRDRDAKATTFAGLKEDHGKVALS